MANLKINRNGNYIDVSIMEEGNNWTTLIKKARISLKEDLEIKGFRKGHVPDNIADKNISKKNIWYKAADLLIDDVYQEAIELLMKEKIATKPSFLVNAVSDESIDATLRSISMPKIKIGNRDSIKIKYIVEKVTEEEVAEEVLQLNKMLQKTIDIKDKNSVAKNGDKTNINFIGKIDGVAFDGGESKDFELELGTKSFIEGFESQIEGMKIGDTKDVKVTFPKEYPEKKLASKEAIFIVTLNSIKETVDLDGDELREKLKSLGFKSKDEIVNKIRDVARERKIQSANDIYFREYVDAIISLKDTEVILPEEILTQEIEQEYQRMEAQIVKQGMKMKEYFKLLGMSEQEFKDKNLKDSSSKRVKDGLIYAQLIEEFGIKAEESDFEAEYIKIAKNSKTKIEEVKKQLNPNSIESNIIYTKLINHIK